VSFTIRLVVALPPLQDLLLCAKHLFVAAMVLLMRSRTEIEIATNVCPGKSIFSSD
jgi:hypothetical protein